MKRFFKTADVGAIDGGYGVLLDGRVAKTRGRAPIVAATRPLAEALVEEWRSQGEDLDVAAMPLTRLQTTVIDLGAAQGAAWADRFVSFGETDLLCYRAHAPAALVARQSSVWDPYLDWARAAHGIDLKSGQGVVHVAQSVESLAALRAAVENAGPGVLLALRLLAEATASAVLPLALWRGGFSGDAVFDAARLDEAYQIEQWGEDEEARAGAQALRRDFDAAAAFLRFNAEG